jgi:hypothetical protein
MAAKARVENCVHEVATCNLEGRLPCDETHLEPKSATKCRRVIRTDKGNDTLCGTCPYCQALGQRKKLRSEEKKPQWFCSTRSYFQSQENYTEKKRHRGGTRRTLDFRRISRHDVTNADLRSKLIALWRRRRIYDDLEDADEEESCHAPQPTFPTEEADITTELNLLVGCLWSDEVSTMYRNWQISNQMHSCRPTCWKYDPYPFDPMRRTCRFNYPMLLIDFHEHAKIKVDHDRKSRLRYRVLPCRNNSFVNNCYIDVALNLFHEGNLDVQFVANDVGAGEYVCCYTSKAEAPDTSIFVKLYAKKFAELDARCELTDRERLRIVAKSLMTATQVGATQARFPTF